MCRAVGAADGTKQLIAIDEGHRESTESWADLLRPCKRRGMVAPVLAVGDGALGFWASAQNRWRAVNVPHLVALVCAGARFESKKLTHRPNESGGDQQAA